MVAKADKTMVKNLDSLLQLSEPGDILLATDNLPKHMRENSFFPALDIKDTKLQ